MELRHIDSNDEVVLTIKVNPVELFVLKKCGIELKNEFYTLFLEEDAFIACKTRCSITFTLQI